VLDSERTGAKAITIKWYYDTDEDVASIQITTQTYTSQYSTTLESLSIVTFIVDPDRSQNPVSMMFITNGSTQIALDFDGYFYQSSYSGITSTVYITDAYGMNLKTEQSITVTSSLR
jgi:hypothetical protein